MYLKSLEISGFKSFAKKVNLEFKHPITAIVGPNGSGKSNVAEAFRFVLGEQSIKSMRGKKGEDLIFNGGKTLGKLNRASVKVIFDNAKRILNIDFDEVIIERVVHRDGVNEYFINGSHVRLRDIIELLASAHIGSSGHHIISQGEADKILNASLKERREMIEDALGLKVYHYKKDESEKKLVKTEENIKSVESLRREIAPHIKFLAKQVEKIEKAEVMRTELKGMYLEYFKREHSYITHEKKRIDQERKIPHERLQHLENELMKAKKILESSGQKDQKSDELLHIEAKLREVRERKDELVRESGKIEGAISSLKRTIEKQRELLQSEENKMVPFKDVEALGKEIEVTINSLEGEENLSTIRQVLLKIRKSVLEFIQGNKVSTHTTLTKDAEDEIRKLDEERKLLDEKVEKSQKEEEETRRRYASLRDDIEREKDSNREAEKAVFKIMAEKNEVESTLALLKSTDERLHHIEEDFKRELQEAAALTGRDVLGFEAYEIRDQSGVLLSKQHMLSEERTKQEERRRVIEKIKIRLEDSGGGASEEVLKEYKEVQERDSFLAREIEDLEKSSETLRSLIAELEEKLTVEFKQGVEKINSQFSNFFALMFGGGSASLAVVQEKKRKKKGDLEGLLEDEEEGIGEEDDAEEGIDIHVALPHKRTKGLMMLSGGERALTSIALLFAISQVNPPPFIILDETDAALDEANSRKYGDMIENLAKYSQLILITHNRETMSRAGVLYGVTMGSEGFSKLLSIEFDEAVAVAK